MKIFVMFLLGIISVSLRLLLPARAEVAALLYSRVVLRREGWEAMSEGRTAKAADSLMECGLRCSRRQGQGQLCNSFSYDDHHASCSLAVVRSQFYISTSGLALSSPRLTVSPLRTRTRMLLMFTLIPRWKPVVQTGGGETGQPGLSALPPAGEELRGERDTVTAQTAVVRRKTK